LTLEPSSSFIMGAAADKTHNEDERRAYLLDAQNKAEEMFEEIGRTLIRAGVSEKALSDEIHDMGNKRHNTRTHWHKRVVRSGPHTLFPYAENPPDRVIQEDDILFVDLGPVFEAWEADFGRTFVLGEDPHKKRLRDCLEPVWEKVKARFDSEEDMTGEKLYDIACAEAASAGYEFGGQHSGHLIGDFPHERIPNDKIALYITKGNDQIMRSVDTKGHQRHWILEVHLVDRERQIGGFFEQLLTAS
jgi:Xaa-Pro aminopeptidase